MGMGTSLPGWALPPPSKEIEFFTERIGAAVQGLKRQCETEARASDRRFQQVERQLHAAVGRFEGNRPREEDWRQRFADLQGSVKGLLDETQAVVKRVDGLDERLSQRHLSAEELARQSTREVQQQLHTLERQARLAEAATEDAGRRQAAKQRRLDTMLEDLVWRVSNLEEEHGSNGAAATAAAAAAAVADGSARLETVEQQLQRLASEVGAVVSRLQAMEVSVIESSAFLEEAARAVNGEAEEKDEESPRWPQRYATVVEGAGVGAGGSGVNSVVGGSRRNSRDGSTTGAGDRGERGGGGGGGRREVDGLERELVALDRRLSLQLEELSTSLAAVKVKLDGQVQRQNSISERVETAHLPLIDALRRELGEDRARDMRNIEDNIADLQQRLSGQLDGTTEMMGEKLDHLESRLTDEGVRTMVKQEVKAQVRATGNVGTPAGSKVPAIQAQLNAVADQLEAMEELSAEVIALSARVDAIELRDLGNVVFPGTGTSGPSRQEHSRRNVYDTSDMRSSGGYGSGTGSANLGKRGWQSHSGGQGHSGANTAAAAILAAASAPVRGSSCSSGSRPPSASRASAGGGAGSSIGGGNDDGAVGGGARIPSKGSAGSASSGGSRGDPGAAPSRANFAGTSKVSGVAAPTEGAGRDSAVVGLGGTAPAHLVAPVAVAARPGQPLHTVAESSCEISRESSPPLPSQSPPLLVQPHSAPATAAPLSAATAAPKAPASQPPSRSQSQSPPPPLPSQPPSRSQSQSPPPPPLSSGLAAPEPRSESPPPPVLQPTVGSFSSSGSLRDRVSQPPPLDTSFASVSEDAMDVPSASATTTPSVQPTELAPQQQDGRGKASAPAPAQGVAGRLAAAGFVIDAGGGSVIAAAAPSFGMAGVAGGAEVAGTEGRIGTSAFGVSKLTGTMAGASGVGGFGFGNAVSGSAVGVATTGLPHGPSDDTITFGASSVGRLGSGGGEHASNHLGTMRSEIPADDVGGRRPSGADSVVESLTGHAPESSPVGSFADGRRSGAAESVSAVSIGHDSISAVSHAATSVDGGPGTNCVGRRGPREERRHSDASAVSMGSAGGRAAGESLRSAGSVRSGSIRSPAEEQQPRRGSFSESVASAASEPPPGHRDSDPGSGERRTHRGFSRHASGESRSISGGSRSVSRPGSPENQSVRSGSSAGSPSRRRRPSASRSKAPSSAGSAGSPSGARDGGHAGSPLLSSAGPSGGDGAGGHRVDTLGSAASASHASGDVRRRSRTNSQASPASGSRRSHSSGSGSRGTCEVVESRDRSVDSSQDLCRRCDSVEHLQPPPRRRLSDLFGNNGSGVSRSASRSVSRAASPALSDGSGAAATAVPASNLPRDAAGGGRDGSGSGMGVNEVAEVEVSDAAGLRRQDDGRPPSVSGSARSRSDSFMVEAAEQESQGSARSASDGFMVEALQDDTASVRSGESI